MIKHYLCTINQPTKLLIMKLLRRKIDKYLKTWKEDENRMPLIVKGARQVGKTASIMQFAYDNYKNVVAINFVLQQKYKAVFEDGYDEHHQKPYSHRPFYKDRGKQHTILLRRNARLSYMRYKPKSIQNRWQIRCNLLRFAYGHQLSRDRIE